MASPSTYLAASYSNFVSNVAIKFLEELEKQPPDMVRDLYTQLPWNPMWGEKVTFDSYALPSYLQRVDENEAYPIVGVQEGDSLNKTQNQYGGKMSVSVRMLEFDKLDLASQFASQMVNALGRTLDLELTHQLFTYADATTYTPRNKAAVDIKTADGLALASASHTVQGTGSTTYSNILSGGGNLSVSNLTALIQQLQKNTVNDKGDIIPFEPDMLIIPNDFYMVKKAREILGSPLTPETNNNAVNVYGPGNDMNMKLVVLKKGALNTLGAEASSLNTFHYRYAIADSRYRQSFQVAVKSEPKLRLKQGSADNAAVDILCDMFACFGVPRWQGIGYSLSTTQP